MIYSFWLWLATLSSLALLCSSQDYTFEELIGDDPIFDILRVRDIDMLTNIMDPIALREEVGPLINETIHIDVSQITEEAIDIALQALHDELEQIYLKLYSVAKFLVYVSHDELFQIADNLIESDRYQDIFETSHPHRDFGFNSPEVAADPGLESDPEIVFDVEDSEAEEGSESEGHSKNEEDSGSKELRDELTEFLTYEDDLPAVFNRLDDALNDEADARFWDHDDEFSLLLEELEGEGIDVDTSGVLEGYSIIKKIKKKIKKKKKKISLILKLIKLKKIVKIKKAKLCIKIMILIEKIKRTIILIVKLVKKLIVYSIKEFPFDVLWKIKEVIRLIVKIVDDALWAAEIATLTAILKIATLIKLGVKFEIEVITYFKMTFLQKTSKLKRAIVDKARSIKGGDDKDDFDQDYELDYDFEFANEVFDQGEKAENEDSKYDEDGIEYQRSDPNYTNEIDDLYKEAFTTNEIENFFEKHNLFNLDVEFPDENDPNFEPDGSEYYVYKRELQELLEDFEITTMNLDFETNSTGDTFAETVGEMQIDNASLNDTSADNSSFAHHIADDNLTVFRTIEGLTSIASSIKEPVTLSIIIATFITFGFVLRRL